LSGFPPRIRPKEGLVILVLLLRGACKVGYFLLLVHFSPLYTHPCVARIRLLRLINMQKETLRAPLPSPRPSLLRYSVRVHSLYHCLPEGVMISRGKSAKYLSLGKKSMNQNCSHGQRQTARVIKSSFMLIIVFYVLSYTQ
jgi:hypothetical protein